MQFKSVSGYIDKGNDTDNSINRNFDNNPQNSCCFPTVVHFAIDLLVRIVDVPVVLYGSADADNDLSQPLISQKLVMMLSYFLN